MNTFKFHNAEVSLNFTTYRSNGTLAVEMNTIPDDEPYGTITVNLSSPFQGDTHAFVDENNLPGISAWLKRHKIAKPTGIIQRSGFCIYELYEFNTAL